MYSLVCAVQGLSVFKYDPGKQVQSVYQGGKIEKISG